MKYILNYVKMNKYVFLCRFMPMRTKNSASIQVMCDRCDTVTRAGAKKGGGHEGGGRGRGRGRRRTGAVA